MPQELMTLQLILVPQGQIMLIACTLVVVLWVWNLSLPATVKIPGPWHLKLTGIFVKYHELFGHKRRWIHNLHLRYGPVVQIASDEVSFASYTAAKQIYSTGNKEFRKTELYTLFEQDGHINLFTALDHDSHSTIRRHLADRYSNSSVLRPQITEMIDERANVFAAVCAASDTADIYFYLHAYALDCVTGMLFHPHRTDSLVDAGDKQMVQLLSYSNTREVIFSTHYLPLLAPLWAALFPKFPDLERGSSMVRRFVQNSLEAGDHSDFTVARKLLESSHVSRPLAEAECLDHIGAGIETTGDTLCWLMWELSQPKHQNKAERLHHELAEAGIGGSLEGMPYLNAVIQEGLRLFAPGTLPLPRYAPKEGAFVDGYFIPENTIVECNSYSMHRLDESTFPNAAEFIPERWLDPESHTDRQRLFFAFGLGPRTCIGRHLAVAEMRACLNAVYSKYRTRPAPGMRSSMEMDDQVLTSRPRDLCCKIQFVPWGPGA